MKKENSKYFSEQLRKIMFERNLTQRVLAAKINISQTVISRWLTTDINPTVSSIQKLAEVLDVPVSYFIENYEQKNSEKTDDDINTKISNLEKLGSKILKELSEIKKTLNNSEWKP